MRPSAQQKNNYSCTRHGIATLALWLSARLPTASPWVRIPPVAYFFTLYYLIPTYVTRLKTSFWTFLSRKFCSPFQRFFYEEAKIINKYSLFFSLSPVAPHPTFANHFILSSSFFYGVHMPARALGAVERAANDLSKQLYVAAAPPPPLHAGGVRQSRLYGKRRGRTCIHARARYISISRLIEFAPSASRPPQTNATTKRERERERERHCAKVAACASARGLMERRCSRRLKADLVTDDDDDGSVHRDFPRLTPPRCWEFS